jgi:hypothetical protein
VTFPVETDFMVVVPDRPDFRDGMMIHPVSIFRMLGASLLFGLSFLTGFAAKWPTLAPQELSATTSTLDPSADAEVLLSSVDITFEDFTTTKSYYRRIKVYTARGVELVQKFAVENSNQTSVARLEARHTKPGGRSTLYGKKDFLENMVLKIGGQKWFSRRLLVSELAPGDIIELRWEVPVCLLPGGAAGPAFSTPPRGRVHQGQSRLVQHATR